MATRTKAQKWGGSVSAPIPAAIAKRLRITPGSPIEVEQRGGVVLIKPVAARRRSLAQILQACKRDFPAGNPHGAIDFGPPVGREIW